VQDRGPGHYGSVWHGFEHGAPPPYVLAPIDPGASFIDHSMIDSTLNISMLSIRKSTGGGRLAERIDHPTHGGHAGAPGLL
jgi:hypothetical protein